jgi:alcohol dehydrogenase
MLNVTSTFFSHVPPYLTFLHKYNMERSGGIPRCLAMSLHPAEGPEVEPGRILGHEAVGTVTATGPGATGPGVRTVAAGDKVLISCVSACGQCSYCREGGYGQCIGVHGRPATLHLEELWSKNVTITTGLVDTNSIPVLLDMLASGHLLASRHLDVSGMITHRFGLDEMQDAYDVFSRPAETGALKVALFRA